MENFKKVLGQWEKLIAKYDRDSRKLQQKVATIVKAEWTTSDSRSESTMKSIIDKSGKI